MHRSQILLEEWQYETLKLMSQRKGATISSVVREILAECLQKDLGKQSAKLSDIEGIGSDEVVSGRDHDQILYSCGA